MGPVLSFRSRLPKCWWEGSDDGRGVAICRGGGGGGVREPVIIQPRDSLAVITANAATSAFICTLATMQGTSLGRWCTVIDGAYTHAVDIDIAGPKRWYTAVDADGPRAVRMTLTPRAQRGGVQQERR